MSEKQKQQPTDQQAESKGDYRQVIGTALFELVWWGMDVRFWWDESHVAFLWWGIAGLAIAIYRHVPSLRIALGAIALLLVAGTVIQSHLPPNETPIHGWLIPADDRVPPDNACAFAAGHGEMAVLLGKAGATGHGSKLRVFNLCGHDVLWVEPTEKGLSVNAEVFDGRIVGDIQNGEFTLNPNNIFRMERPDRHTLIVYDQENQERLNIRFLNPQAIRVTGIFEHPDCPGCRFNAREDAVTTPNGSGIASLCLDLWGDQPVIGCK